SRVEYLKVKGQNMQADFQYISSEEDVDLAEMILFQAMNMEPDQHIEIKPVAKPANPPSIGLENCYRLAVANRPDFKIKAKTIEYYDFDRKMMKAKGWPKIDFTGSFGQMIERFEPMFLPGDWLTPQAGGRGTGGVARAIGGWNPEWYAGVQTSLPLWGNTLEYNYVREKWAPTVSAFRGSESATSYLNFKLLDDLAYFSNLQEARAGFESAKYEYLKAENDLMVEVKERYFRYRKALLQMDVAQAQVEHQKMFVDVLEERLRYAEMEVSKVIEEQEKLAEHEYGLVQGDANYFISLTELNGTIGIPDYFKPAYENQEYDEWKKKLAEEKAAEEEAERIDEEEKKAQIRARVIASYLKKAQTQLESDKFERARGYAEKALGIEEDNSEAQALLDKIDEAEKIYEEEQKLSKAEEETLSKAEEYARQKIKEEQ
ncbi:MAG: TolC family protein, partial [Candidatus Omnitrophota bacterium]